MLGRNERDGLDVDGEPQTETAARPETRPEIAGQCDPTMLERRGSAMMDLAQGRPSAGTLETVLRTRFGLSEFRAWQREAIDELLGGSGRTLVIAPTGGGKSLCYQLPAACLPGTSIVISPLIALMEDQVRRLNERGIPATFLASTVSPEERKERERALFAGRYQLVYVAPERLAFPGVVERLARLRPPLFAVDEAHCIAQWGHDFRPEYMRLAEVIRALEPPRVIACTATATPNVRAEILAGLGLPPDTRTVLRGFARPNLHLSANETEGLRSRKSAMMRALEDALGPPGAPLGGGIVYAATRRSSEELAAEVATRGYRVAAYHAGLPPEQRSMVNESFAARGIDVVVATNAFGMGIDRADIRCVVHVQPPGSIEAYYQEVGRAGRDGAPALGLLLSGSADLALRRRLIEHGRDGVEPSPEEVKRQWSLFLELMRYVEAGSCRHDFILRYFGDEQELLGGCGNCDVCERLERSGEGERRASEDDAVVVRKALSGIARAQRRAGMLAIAGMLHGETDERQERLGLRALSTFGLLRDRPTSWIVSLLRRLVTAGLVEVTASDYPMPYLTGAGVRVMKGQEPVRVVPPPFATPSAAPRPAKSTGGSSRKSGGPAAGMPAAQARLFERLRAARLSLARERGAPAYVICHDRVLVDIAERTPRTLEELGRIPGIGKHKLAAFGAAFLEAVQEEGTERQVRDDASPVSLPEP